MTVNDRAPYERLEWTHSLDRSVMRWQLVTGTGPRPRPICIVVIWVSVTHALLSTRLERHCTIRTQYARVYMLLIDYVHLYGHFTNRPRPTAYHARRLRVYTRTNRLINTCSRLRILIPSNSVQTSALVCPRIKKPSMDQDVLSHFMLTHVKPPKVLKRVNCRQATYKPHQ